MKKANQNQQQQKILILAQCFMIAFVFSTRNLQQYQLQFRLKRLSFNISREQMQAVILVRLQDKMAMLYLCT